MANLAFADEAARLDYDVSDDEYRAGQLFEQLDTGYLYIATAPGVGSWKVASGPQSPRAETASPSAGSLPADGGTLTGDLVMAEGTIIDLSNADPADACLKVVATTDTPAGDDAAAYVKVMIGTDAFYIPLKAAE